MKWLKSAEEDINAVKYDLARANYRRALGIGMLNNVINSLAFNVPAKETLVEKLEKIKKELEVDLLKTESNSGFDQSGKDPYFLPGTDEK
jgi:hypothetical protein